MAGERSNTYQPDMSGRSFSSRSLTLRNPSFPRQDIIQSLALINFRSIQLGIERRHHPLFRRRPVPRRNGRVEGTNASMFEAAVAFHCIARRSSIPRPSPGTRDLTALDPFAVDQRQRIDSVPRGAITIQNSDVSISKKRRTRWTDQHSARPMDYFTNAVRFRHFTLGNQPGCCAR